MASVQELLAKDMEDMVEDIIDQIDHTCLSGYVLFGHSMGEMLVWLTVRKIRAGNISESVFD